MKKYMLLFACVAITCILSPAAMAQKPRLAIQDITATSAVMDNAVSDGQANVLQQILQGSDSQLMDTIN